MKHLIVPVVVFTANSVLAQAGLPLWTNLFGGPYGGYDEPHALICDSGGNAIVTGYSAIGYSYVLPATIKYSGSGLPLWTNIFNDANVSSGSGNAVAVDSQGRVFVTGSTAVTNGGYGMGRFTTLAYSSDGTPFWTNNYAYSAAPNNGTALVIDSNGHVVVTGHSYGGQMQYMYITIAYSGDGVPLWTNSYAGNYIVQLDSYPAGIAADTNGNVFVTGYSSGWRSGYDYATIKYSPTGAPLWINRYNGPANGNDYARAIAVDTEGTVFVTGYASNVVGGYDYTTIAYSNSGTPLWTNTYDGGTGGNDYARALTLDHRGHVFVTGYSTNDASGYDYATIAYTTAGTPLWTNRFGGSANGDDFAVAMAIDTAGNVFVTGYCTNLDTGYDCATVAYSPAGSSSWTNVFSGPENWYDRPYALAADPNGNVFMAAVSLGSGQDFTTIKYSSSLPAPPCLVPQVSAGGMLLQWTNAGWLLQSAPAATGPFTNVFGAASPYPVSFSCPRQFFRLVSGN